MKIGLVHVTGKMNMFFISSIDTRPPEGYIAVFIPKFDHQIISNHPRKDVKRAFIAGASCHRLEKLHTTIVRVRYSQWDM